MKEHLEELLIRYPQLKECKTEIYDAYELLEKTFKEGGKLLICGNGGSASDSEHIVGELMKEFKMKRKISDEDSEKLKEIDSELGKILADNLQGALPSISLTSHYALQTAYMNDVMPELVFAQQVNGYGKPKDILLCISTSGNSKNVLYAAIVAKLRGMKVIGLTTSNENKLRKYCDACIGVPETETYKIQELHLPIYHWLCMMLEEKFFG